MNSCSGRSRERIVIYQPIYNDQADTLVKLAMREFFERQWDEGWFDNVVRFDHFQLRPMRRRGVFF